MSEQLTKEENDILRSFEKGEWKSSPKFDERKMALKRHAQDTIRKDKRVNIRISQRDLNEIKRLAFREEVYPIKRSFPVFYINTLMAFQSFQDSKRKKIMMDK